MLSCRPSTCEMVETDRIGYMLEQHHVTRNEQPTSDALQNLARQALRLAPADLSMAMLLPVRDQLLLEHGAMVSENKIIAQ